MTDFLVKCFVKDHDKTEDPQVRTRYGILASIVGICCNLLLFASKLFIGVLVNSVSVMADAFNNLSDAASSIIGFIGVRMAGKPADSDHPFGHGRIEYISAFIVAFLVIQVGFSLFKTSLGKVLHPEEVYFKWISVLILLISVGVKFWLSLFNRKLGSRINSKVMEATAADAMGDVMTTSAAILSLLALKYLNWNIDGIVGLAVSVAVMYGGLNIAKDTLAPLIGEAIEPEVYEEISNFVEGYEGILGTHDLIVHNYGPSHSMASIHAEVPSNYDPEYSHEIIDRIERDAAKKFNMMLVIHMDPVERDNKRLAQYRSLISRVLMDIDIRLSFHDFRIVGSGKNVCLVFDLVVPREYKASAVGRLKNRINNEVSRRGAGMPLFHHSRKQFSFRETWIGEIGIAAILVLAEGIMGTGIMAMELENWICDMANGDKEGLRQFYEETARSVYSFIFSVLKDPHESEDVMQETFLAVWEHAGDYVPYGKPLAWVFTIARRLCYMRLREKKRQETLEDGEIDDTGVPQPQLEQTAERTALLQALDQLNETERQIVLLYAAAGMKHREIAQVLNMPQATELSKYSRSVKKLQKMLYAS